MTAPNQEALADYTQDVARKAKSASRKLTALTGNQKSGWLLELASAIDSRKAELVQANQLDIDKAPEYGLNNAAIDRLRLTEVRLAGIVESLHQISTLTDPIGEVIQSQLRPNGIRVSQVRVPLGVVFFIYESRPNVTIDAAALCVKSGNAVILRGGKEAFHSNMAFYKIVADSLEKQGLPREAVQLVETTDRDAVGHFLKRHDLIDVTIPRGGRSLIERVTDEATMPVIKHFDGICHVYVDESADLKMAENIIINSKTHRPGVCNAAETLLVHEAVAERFLKQAGPALLNLGVELRGCRRTCQILEKAVPATEEDFRTEYLDLILSVKVVDDLTAAVEHINEHGSHHTDAIVTSQLAAAEEFQVNVDSAAVMVNASTRFNDGGEFGFGAEIGISTDKFHARGPCGLRELTSYKYLVQGSGQTRS
ncbi:Gamma-glutamyl phosphate reductase [Polystyrenella longa]|uniref:Gamma-glutamyl phosphate reductase n=1 Tax=Polystyrenella longa TaxID=2528007 RepID=A0A518CKM0_9PLAN|nr:glutamate-5-semialdehyde dehydrogenase [Polystyrenella longa]QDU79768.1 Gamma-glutamyl phosphate reductase [Polystyrenella longa]